MQQIASTSTTTRHARAIARTAAVALAVGVAAASVGSTSSAGTAPPLGGCTVTPSADALPFDAYNLLATMRITDDVVEVRHDVRCTDGRTGVTWIGGDVIPARD